MCLTGVDYFSTLGYQPAIAFAAAGLLSPIATFVLVLLTLFGALPVYREIARLSPHGEGSVSLLQELLSRWKGKTLVLCLLGFAATDYVITITLSAADATAHILENPLVPHWVEHPVIVTLVLLSALCGIFLRGFREAIGLAVLIVAAYLALNVVVIGWGLGYIVSHPELLPRWRDALFVQHGSWATMAGVSLLLFPKLALGLSGFETGVAVMPLVQGDPGETEANPAGRIRGARRLLLAAALIMSVLLLGSSLVSALLIPGEYFARGGPAYGRALAFLAHEHFGEVFGTLYDLSTITILWFAGSSAMAGLLNLVPRYLPRFGMAPEWTKAMRPLVLVFTGVTFLVTIIFQADVEAQGGAYATGVLVLMSSAALAVTLAAHKSGRWWQAYLLITLVFAYTTAQNIHERPEGIRIAAIFIASIIVMSLVSRVLRSTELRIHGVDADEAAEMFIDQAATTGQVRVIANRPGVGDVAEYAGQDPRGPRHAPAEAVGAGAVRRGGHHRRLGVQQRAEGARRRDRPVPRAALPQRRGAQRHRRPAAAHPRSHRQGAARLLRLDRRQSDRLPAQVPRLRRGRRGAGQPRGAAADRARSRTASPHPPWLTPPPPPSPDPPGAPRVHRGSAAMPPWSVGELPAPPVWSRPELGRR